MIVYQDILSGQEIGSDSHEVQQLYDGTVLAIESKLVKESIGNIDTGANASAEEAEEAVEDEAKQVINLVSAHKLVKFEVTKVEYKALIKDYVKKLGEKLASDAAKAEAFKKNQPKILKFIQEVVFPNFEQMDFYLGEEASADNAMLVPARYIGDATSPTFYYFADGLNMMKY